MEAQGWAVRRHHLLPTAWVATFARGGGGRTVGVNSEMDALPGIGHACGHNLIAIAGVAVACAIRAALERFDVPGTVVLLGTPGECLRVRRGGLLTAGRAAEEGGYGKVQLLNKGAYEDMDICLMYGGGSLREPLLRITFAGVTPPQDRRSRPACPAPSQSRPSRWNTTATREAAFPLMRRRND